MVTKHSAWLQQTTGIWEQKDLISLELAAESCTLLARSSTEASVCTTVLISIWPQLNSKVSPHSWPVAVMVRPP